MRKPTKALIAVLLSVAVSVNADVVRTRGGGSGGGAAAAVTPGVTTVTGCQNRVLFGDNSQTINCDADLVFSGGDTFESTAQTNLSGPDATTNVEIGSAANNANAGTGGTSTVIGNASTNSGNGTQVVIVGNTSTSSGGNDNLIYGNGSSASGGTNRLFGTGLSSTGGTRNLFLGNAISSSVNDLAVIGFSPITTGAVAGDFVFGSAGPANGYNNFYFGKGRVSTTAVSVTHNGTGGSGADNAGGDLFVAAGKGTGTGKGGQSGLLRSLRAATSSTLQNLAPAVIVCPSITLSNTSATAQTIATITTTNATAGAISWFYAVTASNGTAVNVDAGTINVGWNNNADTAAATAGTAVSTANSVGSGTLVALPTATVATNVVSLRVTPTWVTIVPTSVVGYAVFQMATSGDTVVCQ